MCHFKIDENESGHLRSFVGRELMQGFIWSKENKN